MYIVVTENGNFAGLFENFEKALDFYQKRHPDLQVIEYPADEDGLLYWCFTNERRFIDTYRRYYVQEARINKVPSYA